MKMQIQPAWLKELVCFIFFETTDVKYHIENILEIFKEKSIPMVVHSQIIQRAFSKQEDQINFASGGTVPKIVMLFAFAKLMNAILN